MRSSWSPPHVVIQSGSCELCQIAGEILLALLVLVFGAWFVISLVLALWRLR